MIAITPGPFLLQRLIYVGYCVHVWELNRYYRERDVIKAALSTMGPRGLLAWRLGIEKARDELRSRAKKSKRMFGGDHDLEDGSVNVDDEDESAYLLLHLSMRYTPPPLTSEKREKLLRSRLLHGARRLLSPDAAIVSARGLGLEEERFRVAWIMARHQGPSLKEEKAKIERMLNRAAAMMPFKGIEEVMFGECEEPELGETWEMVAVTDKTRYDCPPEVRADIEQRFSHLLAIERRR